MVTLVVFGVGVMVAAAAGDEEEEHPVIDAIAARSSRPNSDPPASIDRTDRTDLRRRPANVSSPTGPSNARVTPAAEWNEPAAGPTAERSYPYTGGGGAGAGATGTVSATATEILVETGDPESVTVAGVNVHVTTEDVQENVTGPLKPLVGASDSIRLPT